VRTWIIVPLLLLAAACSHSSSPTGPTGPSNNNNKNNNPSSTLTATIDGASFVGKTVTATFHDGADFSSLLLNATDAANNLLSFVIGPPLRTAFTPGTYALGANGSNATYNPQGMVGWNGLTGPQTGSVTVTAFSKTDKTASGTFSFVLHNSTSAKTVTNGVFNVTFP
jgi:hypothetical protein